MKFFILTQLKSRDASAATALQCLSEDMGLKERLVEIQRYDAWKLEASGPDDPEQVKVLAERLIHETRIFVNPNKHFYEIIHPIIRLEGADSTGSNLFRIKVLVGEIDNAPGLHALNTLHSLYGFSEITGIEAGVLWSMVLRAESEVEAKELATGISRTTSITDGLLANPHYQKITIL